MVRASRTGLFRNAGGAFPEAEKRRRSLSRHTSLFGTYLIPTFCQLEVIFLKAEDLFERIFGREHPLSDEDSKESTQKDTDLGVRWMGEPEEDEEKHVELDLREV